MFLWIENVINNPNKYFRPTFLLNFVYQNNKKVKNKFNRDGLKAL